MGNITASMGRQLALSKRELETQRNTASSVVASASAAFRLPQMWQKNHTLGQDVTRGLLLCVLKQGCLCAAQSAGPFAQLL